MAVYTQVTDEDLSGLLSLYDLGPLVTFKGIAEGVENTNYLLQTPSGRYILTLYEKRVEVADLPFFLRLVEHLAEHGIHCPAPVHARSGDVLQNISGRKGAIFTFLDGFSISAPKVDHCQQVGHALAKLHLAGLSFGLSRRNSLGQHAWPLFFEKFRSQADTIFPGIENLIETELQFLKSHWPTDLPIGIIHADLFPDNVFFQNNKLSGLIDFYFACTDTLAFDIAICVNAWCFSPNHSYDLEKGRALLQGYAHVRPITSKEKKAFPILTRGSALRFLLTRAHDWLNRPPNALVSFHNPLDYVQRLKFHQSAHSFADYGFNEHQ